MRVRPLANGRQRRGEMGARHGENFFAADCGRVGATGTRAQAAARTPGIWRSQAAVWFQLVKMRLTKGRDGLRRKQNPSIC
jgi:hypothetical protein